MSPFGWITLGVAGQGVVNKLVDALADGVRDRAPLQVKPDLAQRAPVTQLVAVSRKQKFRGHRYCPRR